MRDHQNDDLEIILFNGLQIQAIEQAEERLLFLESLQKAKVTIPSNSNCKNSVREEIFPMRSSSVTQIISAREEKFLQELDLLRQEISNQKRSVFLLKENLAQQQLNTIIKKIESSFQILKDYAAKYPDRLTILQDQLSNSIKSGWCINHFYSHSDTDDTKRVYSAINDIVYMSNRLPLFYRLKYSAQILLPDVTLARVHESLGDHLRSFGSPCSDDIEFNSWNSSKYQKFSIQELFTLLYIEDIDPSNCHPALEDWLGCFFNDSKFTQHLRDVIDSNQSSQLNLLNLRQIIKILYKKGLNISPEMTAFEIQLNMISSCLRDHDLHYTELPGGLSELNIPAFNSNIQLYLFNHHIYSDTPHLELHELTTKYDNASDSDIADQNIKHLLDNPFCYKMWLHLSKRSQINKYDILFDPQYDTLFTGSSLKEIYQLLSSNINPSKITPNLLVYFTSDTPQYQLYQAIKENSGNEDFKTKLQTLETFVAIIKFDRQNNNSLSCQEADALPTSPLSPSKKRNFDEITPSNR